MPHFYDPAEDVITTVPETVPGSGIFTDEFLTPVGEQPENVAKDYEHVRSCIDDYHRNRARSVGSDSFRYNEIRIAF